MKNIFYGVVKNTPKLCIYTVGRENFCSEQHDGNFGVGFGYADGLGIAAGG
jgi:hypothetical protein